MYDQNVYECKKYIIVDEISMCNTFIYSILDQIAHFHPDTLFILCGDFHQIQPIGEEELDFKDSYILKLLAKQQKWFLDVNHRTDSKGGLVSMLKFMTQLGKIYRGQLIDVATLTNAIRNNTKESKNLTSIAQKSLDTNNLMSKLEIGFLVLIGLIIQFTIFYRVKKSKTENV